MDDMQILQHTRKECKCHPVWIPKGGRKMLCSPLRLGLTRKDEVAIVSGHELYCRSNRWRTDDVE